MTLEEALRFIDPETDMDALAEVEYYNGFKGKEAAAKTLREASQMVVDFVRRVSWHDAKTPPPVHDESWENAGEKHCCIMSELVWVCCESRNTMKGWIERQVVHRGWPTGGRYALWCCEVLGSAAGAAGGSEMKIITVKHEVSPGYGKCEFGGDFWGKEVCKYHALRTQTHGNKAPPEYRKPKCLLFNCWLEEPYKKCEPCRRACAEVDEK